MDSPTDLDGQSRSLELLRAAVRTATAARDAEGAMSAVRVWSAGRPADQAARAWLSLAEEWAGDDERVRRTALQAACDAAWSEPEMFGFVERAFVNARSEVGIDCALRTRAERSSTGSARAQAWREIGDRCAVRGNAIGAVDAYEAMVRSDTSRAAEALELLDVIGAAVGGPRFAAAREFAARASGDARQLLRALDSRFRELVDRGDAAVVGACRDVAKAAFEATRDFGAALGYVDDAWDVPGVDRAALLDVAEELAGPTDVSRPIAGRLAELSTEVERWGSAARWHRAASDRADSAAARSADLVAAGDALAKEAGSLVAALDAYEEAASADPSAAATVAGRLERLAEQAVGRNADAVASARRQLLRVSGQWDELHAQLTADAASGPPERRAATLAELADLQFERLHRPEEAVQTLLRAIEAGPSETTRATIGHRLERLARVASTGAVAASALVSLRERGAPAELGAALRLAAEHADDPDAARAMLLRAAEQLEAGGDPGGAADALSKVNATAPEDGRALRVASLLRGAGRYDEALAQLDATLAADGPDAGSARAQRLVVLLDAGRLEDALFAAHEALRVDRDDADAASVFARIASAPDGGAVAIEAARLARHHGAEEVAALLWRAAEVQGLAEPSGTELALRALESGGLAAESAGTLRESLIDADPSVVERFHRAVLAGSPPPDDARTSHMALGRLLSEEAPEEAREHFEAVVTAAPDDADAWGGLLAIARAEGNVAAVAQVLEERVENLLLEQKDAIGHLEELIALYELQLGRADLAFDAARRLLHLAPGNPDALRVIDEYASTVGDDRLRYEALGESIEDIEDPAARAEREVELADIALRLAAPETAARHLLAAARTTELDSDARVAAGRRAFDLATDRHDRETATAAALALVAAESAARRAETSEELIDRLGALDASAALEVAAAAAAWDDASGGVLDRHAQLALAVGDPSAAAASLGRWVSRDGAAVPLDRRAQHALLALDLASDNDATWEAVAGVLLHEPDHDELVTRLAAFRDDGDRVAGLAAALLAGAADCEPEVRIPVLYRAADLAIPRATETAEAAWRAIVAEDPKSTAAVDALRASLRERGDAVAESTLIRTLLQSADEDEAVVLLKDLADLAQGDDEAEARHLAVLEADLSDVRARVALADIYERTDRAQRAVELLEEAAEFSDPADARPILDRAARLYLDVLANPDASERCLEAIVAANSADVATWDRLADRYRTREKWSDLVRVLEHKAQASPPGDVRSAALAEVASVREMRLDDGLGAVAALERILDDEPSNLTVLQEVARLHEAAERWEELVAAFDRIAAVAPIPELRRELMLRAAPELLDHLDRADDAHAMLMAAFEIAPPSDDEIALLVRVAEQTGKWLEVAGALRAASEAETDPTRRARLEFETARTLAAHANEPETAVRWLADLVIDAPGMGDRLTALETIATDHGLERLLVEPYKALASASAEEPETLWHALSRSADIAERVIGHPEVAFGIMARAAETPALRERADEAMRALADKHGLWTQYRDVLADEAATDEPAALDAQLRQARIESERLGDWKAAFETLLGAFREAPFDEAVRTPLFALADEHDGWPFVAKMLEVMQDEATPSDRARLVTEIASIYGDRLGKPVDAFSQQLRAWQMAPEDEELRAALEKRADTANMRVDLLAAYEWHARQPARADVVTAALERAGRLAVSLGLRQRAIALYLRLAEADGGAEARAALERADSVFVEADARSWTVELARAIGRMAGASSARANALVRGAEIAAEIGDAAGRVACLNDAVALARDPATLRPLLVDALRAAGDAAGLARELELVRAESTNPATVRATTTELVELYRGALGDEARAVSTARRLMEMEPESDDARALFIEVLTAYERWPDLVDLHLRLADGAADPSAARDARLEAARIAEELLDDPRRAVRIADAVLEGSGSDRTALELRARALASLGRWKDHIDTLERLAAASHGADAAAVYAQAAAVFEHQLVYSDRALEMWEKASTANPSDGHAVAEQARLHGELGHRELALETWARAAEILATGDPAAHCRALTAYAVEARSAGAEVDVLGLLRKAVAADPANPVARGMFEEVLLEAGDAKTVLALLDTEFERAPSDEARGRVLCRRAEVLFYEAGNDADALKTLQRAAPYCDGRKLAALSADIHLVGGRWDEAAEAYDLAFAGGESLDGIVERARAMMPGETVDRTALDVVYLSRAGYAHEAGGRLGRAQDYYAAAHLTDEGYGPAIVGLARLALRRGTPAGAAIYVDAYRSSGPHDADLDEQMADIEIAAGRR